MRRSLLILLVACTLVVAMVPRHRLIYETSVVKRAGYAQGHGVRYYDIKEKNSRAQDTENGAAESGSKFCAEQTPCFWSIYKSGFKNLIEVNVTNTYCICTPSQSCTFSHEDEFASTYVYRCFNDS